MYLLKLLMNETQKRKFSKSFFKSMRVKPTMEGEKHVHANVGDSRSQLKTTQKTMRVKPALGGEKHVHVNVGESRSKLKIPHKTVDLAVQKSHSSL